MEDYSTMKSYLEKNNVPYFTFFTNSEKPIKAVIRHFLPDTPEEDISTSLEDLGFNVVNVTTTPTAPNGQTQVESLALFLLTLTGNIKSQRDIQTE
jgi:hypothetical protein